jgi:hypothetical protein
MKHKLSFTTNIKYGFLTSCMSFRQWLAIFTKEEPLRTEWILQQLSHTEDKNLYHKYAFFRDLGII